MSVQTLEINSLSSRNQLWRGAKAELPILVGVIPFGMIYGVLAIGAGIPAGEAQAMSVIVFAGSAQFIAAQLFASGVPGLVILVTAAVVNLRHVLYSASIAPYIQRLPWFWKGILAYLLTDEAYAVVITHYQEKTPMEASANNSHWYFLGAGLALWSTWQVSTAVGIFLGAQVPAGWSLDFTLALTFIALVVPSLKDRSDGLAALAAGIVAVLAFSLPYKLGLLVAALIGIFVGLWSETK